LAVVTLLAAIGGAAAAGCETEPTDASAGDGLLVLAGDVGSVKLTVREDGGRRSRAVELPAPGTTWIAAGRANVLLATVTDGRTFVSDPLGDDDPAWRLVEPVTLTDEPPRTPLFYGTWDPPGSVYAQLGADFSDDRGMRAVVTDPSLDQAVEVPMETRQAVPAPPAWIDDDRIALVSGNGDRTEAVIVDSATQESEPGPRDVRLIATSGDAATAAVWAGSDGDVEVLSTEAWLVGDASGTRISPPAGASAPVVLALDDQGRRLAVVWADGDGTPTSISIHLASDDWARATTFDLGDASAAMVAWLR